MNCVLKAAVRRCSRGLSSFLQWCLFFPAHKNSCKHWKRVEGYGMGPWASTVCFIPPPGRKKKLSSQADLWAVGIHPWELESLFGFLTSSLKIRAVFFWVYILSVLIHPDTALLDTFVKKLLIQNKECTKENNGAHTWAALFDWRCMFIRQIFMQMFTCSTAEFSF